MYTRRLGIGIIPYILSFSISKDWSLKEQTLEHWRSQIKTARVVWCLRAGLLKLVLCLYSLVFQRRQRRRRMWAKYWIREGVPGDLWHHLENPSKSPRKQPCHWNVPIMLAGIFFILFHPETASLNKKTEIYQGCKHKHLKFLEDCKVTWNWTFNPSDPFTFLFLPMFHI